MPVFAVIVNFEIQVVFQHIFVDAKPVSMSPLMVAEYIGNFPGALGFFLRAFIPVLEFICGQPFLNQGLGQIRRQLNLVEFSQIQLIQKR